MTQTFEVTPSVAVHLIEALKKRGREVSVTVCGARVTVTWTIPVKEVGL